MTRSWEQEKEYCRKRAAELGGTMDQAIETGNKERFAKAYQTAMRYMSRKELNTYQVRFLERMVDHE